MLNDPVHIGFEAVDRVGFAMRRPAHLHVGLLFKHRDKVFLRHQCNHLDLREEEAGNPFDLWVDINALSDLNKRLIANKMAKAGRDKVPYGVGYRVGSQYIDKRTMKYSVTEPGRGLTCSTYILAALETLGFFPFDHSTWVSTLEDTTWQENMLELQGSRHPEAKEHIEAEKTNVGSPRYKPEHIMASAFPDRWPLSRDQALDLGAKVVADYDAKRPPVPKDKPLA